MAGASDASAQVHLRSLETFETLDAWGRFGWRPRGDGWGLTCLWACRVHWCGNGWPQGGTPACGTMASFRVPRFARYLCAFCAAHAGRGKLGPTAPPTGLPDPARAWWINPPVAYMLHAGVPLLLAAGVYLPGLHTGCPACGAEPTRPAGARVLQRRGYKSDDRASRRMSA